MSSKWLSLEHAMEKAIDATSILGESETIALSRALGRITASEVQQWMASLLMQLVVNQTRLCLFRAPLPLAWPQTNL